MSRRITAREAYMNYTMSSKDVLQVAAEKAAKYQIKETIKLVKILQGKGRSFSVAAKIAKRAYRMGIRSTN